MIEPMCALESAEARSFARCVPSSLSTGSGSVAEAFSACRTTMTVAGCATAVEGPAMNAAARRKREKDRMIWNEWLRGRLPAKHEIHRAEYTEASPEIVETEGLFHI